MFCRASCLLTVGLLSTALDPADALAIDFNRIVFADASTATIASNFAVNDSLDVVYQLNEINTQSPAGYVGRFGGAAPITVIDAAYASTVEGPIALSNNRAVAFQSFSPNNPDTHGIFLRNAGGQLTKDANAPRGGKAGAPAMNDMGDVVFLAMDDSIQVRIAGGLNGSISSVPFSSDLSRPAVNNAGSVVIGGRDGMSGGAVVYPAGGGTPLPFTSGWRPSSSQPQIANTGATLFAVEGYSPPLNQPSGVHEVRLAVPNASGTGYSIQLSGYLDHSGVDSYLNDSLSIARVDGDQLDLYLLRPTTPIMTWTKLTLLSIGDALDGSTVTSLALGDGSMLADNSVVFHATLANGGSGLYQVVVPEPTTIGALGCLLLLVRRRR